MKSLSIIIPVLNEADCIQEKLIALNNMIDDSVEVIVVDGGSQDHSYTLAKPLADLVLLSAAGRAAQMNAGAKKANGEMLLFLHIDTQLPSDFLFLLTRLKHSVWGFFSVALSGRQFEFRIIEKMINLRSRITSVATGDQCIFVNKKIFEKLNGYQSIPLMEDVDLSKRLRKIATPNVVNQRVMTSSRRWQENGIWRTVILMLRLRLAFFMGRDPHSFVERYYPKK